MYVKYGKKFWVEINDVRFTVWFWYFIIVIYENNNFIVYRQIQMMNSIKNKNHVLSFGFGSIVSMFIHKFVPLIGFCYLCWYIGFQVNFLSNQNATKPTHSICCQIDCCCVGESVISLDLWILVCESYNKKVCHCFVDIILLNQYY